MHVGRGESTCTPHHPCTTHTAYIWSVPQGWICTCLCDWADGSTTLLAGWYEPLDLHTRRVMSTGVPTIKATLYTLFEGFCVVIPSQCDVHRRFNRRRTRMYTCVCDPSNSTNMRVCVVYFTGVWLSTRTRARTHARMRHMYMRTELYRQVRVRVYECVCVRVCAWRWRCVCQGVSACVCAHKSPPRQPPSGS